MKKIKLLTLALMLVFLTSISGSVTANETIKTPNKLIVFKINHDTYYTQDIGSSTVNTVQMDVAPFIKDSRTFIPVRFLGNALGVSDSNISWNDSLKKATLQGKSKLELVIGSKTMQKDNQKIGMDVAPMITNSRTMLPARYVAEGLGFEVGWDEANQLVLAWPEGQPQPDLAVIKEKLGIEKPISNVTVQDLGKATGKQDITATGYKLYISSTDISSSTMFLCIGDGSRPKQNIRVVCTSHPELNTCKKIGWDGEYHTINRTAWTNDYILSRDGYSPNPQSGMTVTFDIYGGYNGDSNYPGVKIATVKKTLP